MARKPPKHEWHQLKNGTWCRTLGFRGTRVRLFERSEGGGFQRAVRLKSGRVSRKSLGTNDREEAERALTARPGKTKHENRAFKSALN